MINEGNHQHLCNYNCRCNNLAGLARTLTSQLKKEREGEYVLEVLKDSAKSITKSIAGALAAVIREKKSVEIQAIGAGAVNQAIKAIAIARGYVAPNGINLVCIPAFSEVEIEGEERTAIKFMVQPR